MTEEAMYSRRPQSRPVIRRKKRPTQPPPAPVKKPYQIMDDEYYDYEADFVKPVTDPRKSMEVRQPEEPRPRPQVAKPSRLQEPIAKPPQMPAEKKEMPKPALEEDDEYYYDEYYEDEEPVMPASAVPGNRRPMGPHDPRQHGYQQQEQQHRPSFGPMGPVGPNRRNGMPTLHESASERRYYSSKKGKASASAEDDYYYDDYYDDEDYSSDRQGYGGKL